MYGTLYNRVENRATILNRSEVEKARRADREAAERMQRRVEDACLVVALLGFWGVFSYIGNRSSIVSRMPRPGDILAAPTIERSYTSGIQAFPQLSGELLVTRAKANVAARVWGDSLMRAIGRIEPGRLAAGLKPGQEGNGNLPDETPAGEDRPPITLSRSKIELGARQAMYAAHNDGIALAASSPLAEAFIPLWTVQEVLDEVTRGNPFGEYPEPHRHWQFSGYTNTMRELIRQRCVPPCGFNCRAIMVPMLMLAAETKNLVVAGVLNQPAIAASNGGRQLLIDNGTYPDRGFVR